MAVCPSAGLAHLEIEAVAVELREATTSLSITEVTERPLRVTPKVVRQTIDEMTGILEHAPLDTRVAWVRDLFERIDVDSRESHAVAVWKAVTDEGVNPLDSVSEWLRRAGPARLLNSRGTATSQISLPHPGRSREWLKVALLECARCHQVVERRSPVQRYCADCHAIIKQERSRWGMARARRDSSG